MAERPRLNAMTYVQCMSGCYMLYYFIILNDILGIAEWSAEDSIWTWRRMRQEGKGTAEWGTWWMILSTKFYEDHEIQMGEMDVAWDIRNS